MHTYCILNTIYNTQYTIHNTQRYTTDLIFGSFAHHFGITWAWTSFGHHSDIMWTAFDNRLDIIWTSFGYDLGIIWASFGHHLDISWTSVGHHFAIIDIIWASIGTHPFCFIKHKYNVVSYTRTKTASPPSLCKTKSSYTCARADHPPPWKKSHTFPQKFSLMYMKLSSLQMVVSSVIKAI